MGVGKFSCGTCADQTTMGTRCHQTTFLLHDPIKTDLKMERFYIPYSEHFGDNLQAAKIAVTRRLLACIQVQERPAEPLTQLCFPHNLEEIEAYLKKRSTCHSFIGQLKNKAVELQALNYDPGGKTELIPS